MRPPRLVLAMLCLAGSVPADDPARPVTVRSEIEGPGLVIFAVKDGQRVKPGDLVVEFDSATFRDHLINQEITVKQKEAQVVTAAQRREMRVLEKETVVLENTSMVSSAKLSLKLAQNRMTLAQTNHRVAEQANLSERGLRDFQIEVLKAQNGLDDASQKLEILTRFTVVRRDTSAEAAIKMAESVELRCQAERNLAKARMEQIRRDILACRVKAPIGGTVTLFRREGQERSPVREGETVPRGQILFTIRPDLRTEVEDLTRFPGP